MRKGEYIERLQKIRDDQILKAGAANFHQNKDILIQIAQQG